MASRPHVPNISTNTSRDNVSGGRVSTDSPHARTPVMHSSALSDSMSSRVGKRPLESQSRGESPPDKRSRPPDSQSALQDRYANSAGSRIPSPPPSRKSSCTGLTNVSTGLRLASDQHRPESPQYQRRQNVRVLSPSSIGSGASTPTHHAPPAPSMLPAADLSTLRRSADVTSSTTDSTPITMQSLRRLKERKRAIAHQMTASVSKTVEAKLTTQAIDIAYLKKERDQIIKDREKELDELKKQLEEERNQTKRRLDEVETMAAHFPTLMDRTNTLKLVNAAASSLADRLGVLEQSATELPILQKGLQDLATMPNRLATLESRQIIVQPKPEPNQLNVLDNSELKTLADRLSSLEAAEGALAKVPRLENDITMLKNAKELHKIDIDTLKTWKDAQPRTVSEETINNLITTKVQEKAVVHSKALCEKADESNRKLAERITANETSIRDFQTQLVSLQVFREKAEKQKLADQLSVLNERIKTVEGNDAKTYAKADKLRERLKKLEDEFYDLSPKGLDKMHDRLEKLEDKLLDKVDEIREDIKSTKKDLSKIEKAFDGYQADIAKFVGRIKGDFKDTGFSLSERVASLRTTVTEADLGRLPIRLNELEKSARNLDRLTTRVDDLDKLPARVDELEKVRKGPGFRKVGTPVLPPSVPNTPAIGDLNEKVDSLDKSLQQLRKSVTGTNSMTSQLDAHDERIDNIEAAFASARPLDSVEQTVETTGDKALDKTLEKAVEKKVKTLVSAEWKAVERNLEELETRLMEEIQALRNRTRESGVSSADTTAAPSMQFDANALNDVQRDLETLFEKFETQDATISSLSDFVPGLFREHFDPFKIHVEEQLHTTSNTLDKYGHDLSNLTQQVANPSTQQNSFGQQQQAQLNAMVAEAATLKTDFAALKTSVSTKADAEKTSQQLQGITFALNNLQSRYENINTEDIYKRMVEWFMRLYPNLTEILEDISQLKALKTWVDHHANLITGLSQDAENLFGLVSVATQLRELANITLHVKSLVNRGPQLESLASSTAQLQSLVNSAPALDQLLLNASQVEALARSNDASPQTLAKIEQACSDVQIATSRAEQASSDASTAIMKAEQASSDAMAANAKAEQAASEAQTANTKNAEIEHRLIEEVNTLEILGRSVKVIQKSLHNLNSDNSPFARVDVVETLRTLLDEEMIGRVASANQLRAQAQAEAEIKKSISENIQALRSTFDNDRSKRDTLEIQIQKSVKDLERTLHAFQSNVSNMQSANSKNIQTLSSDLNTDRGKRDTAESDIKKAVDEIQKSINELKQTTTSDKASFVKAEALDALKRTLEAAFQTGINNEKAARVAAIKNLRGGITTDTAKILNLEKETESYSNKLKQIKSDYEANVPKIWEQLRDVQGAGAELRKEFDSTVSTYIEPNRDLFGLLGTAIMVISQLQQVVESLNQNLPVAPLKLEWQCYLPTLGQPEANGEINGEPSNSKGKGKGKGKSKQ